MPNGGLGGLGMLAANELAIAGKAGANGANGVLGVGSGVFGAAVRPRRACGLNGSAVWAGVLSGNG